MAISVTKDNDVYKALVRTAAGSERLTIPANAIPLPWFRKVLRIGPDYLKALLEMSHSIPVNCLVGCKDQTAPNDLLAMEERQVIRSYKFGVAYLAQGQTTEEEMFSNTMGPYLILPKPCLPHRLSIPNFLFQF